MKDRAGTEGWVWQSNNDRRRQRTGKIQDGYTCQKQVKNVKFLEFVVSMLFFLQMKNDNMKNQQKTHTTRYKELGLTKQCNERTTH